jgi:hypothetical protein
MVEPAGGRAPEEVRRERRGRAPAAVLAGAIDLGGHRRQRRLQLPIDPDVAQLSAGVLGQRLRTHGFQEVRDAEVIPGITRVVSATKPR